MNNHLKTGLMVLLLLGCQVQWVSEYDEQTDKSVTQYQRAFNVFSYHLADAESYPNCGYQNFANRYAELLAEAIVIHTRAQSIALNTQTVEQTDALVKNLREIQLTHKETDLDEECLSTGYIAQSSALMNQVVRAILFLEQGKKRKYVKVDHDQH